ncbi:MAG: COX15/CtaA family protein [Rhodobacteraceae bacterium]|nr:COX15/CtaA family protein [Paracoccaceae bacterium]
MAAKKRSIFEDVGTTGAPVAPQVGMIAARSQGWRGPVRGWLIVLFLMIMAMVMLGGLVRLADIALPVVNQGWPPVWALPPLTDADWQAALQTYQASPPSVAAGKTIEIAAFKLVYGWDWGRNLLGPVVAAVWLLGFLAFFALRKIPRGWTGRLFGLAVLGALHATSGIWMAVPEVAALAATYLAPLRLLMNPYPLALDLGLAFVILGTIAWSVFLLGRSEQALLQARRAREGRLFGLSGALMAVAFMQIILGAMVAGLDGGQAVATWPAFLLFPADALYVPDGQGGGLPIWRAVFENPALVQFMHQMSGYVLVAFGLVVWGFALRSVHRNTRFAFHLVLLIVLVQVGLGIMTMLSGTHLYLAITHQVGAIFLWVLILRARHLSQYPLAGSIRKGTA